MPWSRHTLDSASSHYLWYEKPFYRAHPTYGFTQAPGVHRVRFEYRGASMESRIEIGEDGYRITRPASAAVPEGPVVSIHGCSWVLGGPLPDHETAAWVIQQRRPELDIRNRGVAIHGNTIALLQLLDSLEHGRPDVAVLAYNDFHCQRNVAAPRFLDVHEGTRWLGDLMFPRAGLRQRGGLFCTLVPLIDPFRARADATSVNPDVFYEYFVTKRVFEEVKRLCEDNDIELAVVYQTGGEENWVVAHLRSLGVHVYSASITIDETSSLLPFDGHPNARSNTHFADVMERAIQDALDRRNARKRAAAP